jgi:PST family polysaccharide transporter
MAERFKQLALLTNNSLIGSAASYFLSIYLANKLGTEKFGLYSYILVVSSISVIFINWASDQTAPSYFSEGKSKSEIFNIVLTSRLLVSFIVTIFLLFWKEIDVFVFAAVLVINVSAFNLSFLFEISAKNTLYSFVYMVERLFYVFLVFTLFFLGHEDLEYVIGSYLIVTLVSLGVQYLYLERKSLFTYKQPRPFDLFVYFKKNVPFVIISLSAFVYGGISRLFIGDKLGMSALGVFSSGMQITVLASIFQAQVERIWRVPLFVSFSECDKVKIKTNVWSFIKLSTFPSFLVAIVFALFSNQIVEVLFSKEYKILGSVLPVISLFFVTINLTSLLTICWFALKKSKEYLIISGMISLVLVGILYILPSTATLAEYVLSILLCQVGLIIYSSMRIYYEVEHFVSIDKNHKI